MAKQFLEYVNHPITGASLVNPIEMTTLKFPLIKDYSPQASQTPYAVADCYNIIYIGNGNTEYLNNLKLTIIDTLGTFPDAVLTYGGIVDGTGNLNDPLPHGKFYLAEAATMRPEDIRASLLSGNDVLGNMPGSIWVDGRGDEGSAWGDTVQDTSSPLRGKPRFELKIENAYFYLTTSSIGSLINNLQWRLNEATNLPIKGKVPYYDDESYYGHYDGSDMYYANCPSLRTGKPLRALDALPYKDSSTQPNESSLVRRTSQGTIAPGSCGYRIPVTIAQTAWSGNDANGWACTVTVNNDYIKTTFNGTNGERDEGSSVHELVVTTNSIVYCNFADSTSFENAFNAHMSPSIEVNDGSLGFSSKKKPNGNVVLDVIIF